MKRLSLSLMTALSMLVMADPVPAQEITSHQQEITAYLTQSQGHLIDWSQSGRRIERIFVDNPEQFRESFVFATDGCTKDKCAASTTILNIGARGEVSRIKRGSLKVVLVDRRNRKSVVLVRLLAVPWFVSDSITTVRNDVQSKR